jgi:hypothetical protein
MFIVRVSMKLIFLLVLTDEFAADFLFGINPRNFTNFEECRPAAPTILEPWVGRWVGGPGESTHNPSHKTHTPAYYVETRKDLSKNLFRDLFYFFFEQECVIFPLSLRLSGIEFSLVSDLAKLGSA